jgi:hypothetical protein
MTPWESTRLRRLCELFSISIFCTEDNPPAALSTLSCLYAMPAIQEHDERRRYGNQILQSTLAFFTPSDGPKSVAFFGLVSGIVIEMQEFPSWFTALSQSPEELVGRYQFVVRGLEVLAFLGIGTGTLGAFSAGIKEALKAETAKDMAKAGLKQTLSRLAGRGAIYEGIAIRYETVVAAMQPSVFFFIGAATALYFAFMEEARKIKLIILDKFQSGKISNELFSKVITEVDPDDIKKYWEK